jgi:ABC-2 type transport system permease protein
MRTFFRDTNTVFLRAMRLSLRNPVWVIMGIVQPLLYLFLFGPLLKPIADELGAENAWQLFVPGLLVQLGIFGAMFVGFGLVAEYRAGVIEAMRVTPAARGALLLGRVQHDVVVLLFQTVLLLLAGLILGLRAPFGGVLLGLVIVALVGSAFSSASYAVALLLKSEDSLAPLLNGVAVPLLLLSGILLPMDNAPRWLRWLSNINPLKHVVDGTRAMFNGDVLSGPAMGGLAAAVALAIAGGWFGTATFRRESA